jgi:hypothetical protein
MNLCLPISKFLSLSITLGLSSLTHGFSLSWFISLYSLKVSHSLVLARRKTKKEEKRKKRRKGEEEKRNKEKKRCGFRLKGGADLYKILKFA